MPRARAPSKSNCWQSDGINPSVPPRSFEYVHLRTRIKLRPVISATDAKPPHILMIEAAGSMREYCDIRNICARPFVAMFAIFHRCEISNKRTMEKIDADWIKARLSDERGERARLAKVLGVKPDQVTKILTGVRQLQTDELPKVVEFFGLTLEVLSVEERDLLEAWRKSTGERRSVLQAVLGAVPRAETQE